VSQQMERLWISWAPPPSLRFGPGPRVDPNRARPLTTESDGHPSAGRGPRPPPGPRSDKSMASPRSGLKAARSPRPTSGARLPDGRIIATTVKWYSGIYRVLSFSCRCAGIAFVGVAVLPS